MRLTVISGEAPWEPGQMFEGCWEVTLEVVSGEPPWEAGRCFTAYLEESPGTEKPQDE